MKNTPPAPLKRVVEQMNKYKMLPDTQYFRFSNAVLIVPLSAVLLIWTVYYIEIRFQINLNHFGIYPRTLRGLLGIFLSPLIHGSLEHLYNNTLPIVLLLASLFYFYKNNAWQVLFLGLILSGVITWIIGRSSYHIGASGLIYVLVSFIFFKGIFTKYYRLVALSLIIVFIYGSLFWYIFPIEDGISWEGHLGGFITGLLLAWTIKTKIPSLKKFDWEHDDYPAEEDEFLRHFDADGNFIEAPQPPKGEPEVPEEEKFKITYHYKASKKEDEA